MSDRRIELIDALRGLAISLMVIYHFGYCLAYCGVMDIAIIETPFLNTLRDFFAGVFILICGFSCKLSRNNLKRGVILLVIALLYSVASFIVGAPIFFGILWCLATCILIYAAAERIFPTRQVNANVLIAVCLCLFLIAYFALGQINQTRSLNPPHLWIFGIIDSEFRSLDYFPLLPWLPLFLAGVGLGSKKYSERFYSLHIPILPKIGRYTIYIYLLHMPIVYLLALAIKAIMPAAV